MRKRLVQVTLILRTNSLWLFLVWPIVSRASLQTRNYQTSRHTAMTVHYSEADRRRFLRSASLALPAAIALPLSTRAEPSEAQRSTGLLVPGRGPEMSRAVIEGPSWDAPFSLQTNLAQSRIQASELSPLRPSLSPFADQELYYAPFLFGEWNTTATLKQKIYPYGVDFVPSRSLLEGSPRNREEQVGDTTVYKVRFFSTLADTISNKVTVNLGTGVPRSEIIADREFNAISMSTAYKQLTPVQEVDWNPTKDPTRLTLNFGPGPLTEDMRPLGVRRGEVYITARQSEQLGEDTFCAAERSRSVSLAPGDVVVSDTESTTEFRMIDTNRVDVVSRIAVYLTPNPNSREGVLWQQIGGRAVALFDYEMNMKRNEDAFIMSDGRVVKRPCVRTPKDLVQCA